MHGGRSTGPTTAEGKARTVAAMVAGRKRWVERMQRAKAAGLVDRFPGGRRRGRERRPKTGGKLVGLALRRLDDVLRRQSVPPDLQKPIGQMELHELVTANMHMALRRLHEILSHSVRRDDVKGARLVGDVARSVLALAAKINPEPLRARRPGRMLELLERLRASGD